MKKYIIISGFNVKDNNRGTAALGYGSLTFCILNGYLQDGQELVNFGYYKNFLKKEYRNRTESYIVAGKVWKRHVIYVNVLERLLYDKFHILLPFSNFKRTIRNTEIIACINGGDGLSDIYNTNRFLARLSDAKIAMREGIPLVQLPQTMGPFEQKINYEIAKEVLLYSKDVYVRDDKFVGELDKMGVSYTITNDLSAYMEPAPWDIDIKDDSIGINVSGLCYSNNFGTLAGQFEQYPNLINRVIELFQKKGKTIYLIPHSYCYNSPEEDNDDIIACRAAYDKLVSKKNVVVFDYDMTSPQVKYVISRMSYFIGTRMHANFAAIYTGVPLFGLAYSYKFKGAFDANGLDGEAQTEMINNIDENKISLILEKINNHFAKQA